MILYLIRHGQTPWNAEKRLQGRSDIDLNENGMQLAKLTGRALNGVPFFAAFTSPLKRAVHTAELLLCGRDIPLTKDGRLTEISFGVYEGKSIFPGEYEIQDASFRHFFDAPHLYVPPQGGETFDEVEARTADFMRDICSRRELADKTVLVSTHGCALRGLLNSVNPQSREHYWNGGVSKNCAVSIVECRDGRMRLLEENKVFY